MERPLSKAEIGRIELHADSYLGADFWAPMRVREVIRRLVAQIRWMEKNGKGNDGRDDHVRDTG